MDRITINAVVYEKDGFWNAQCLEYDLASFAKELADLPSELTWQIQALVNRGLEIGCQPFADFGRAPAKYWELLDHRTQDPRLPESISIPPVEVRLLVTPPPKKRRKIHAVVFREDELWIAQCLEYDFVSCAEELEDLPGELMRQIRGQIRVELEAGKEPFADFGKAPAKYWEMYRRGHLDPRLPEPPLLPQFEVHLSLVDQEVLEEARRAGSVEPGE